MVELQNSFLTVNVAMPWQETTPRSTIYTVATLLHDGISPIVSQEMEINFQPVHGDALGEQAVLELDHDRVTLLRLDGGTEEFFH
ncbi:hypothetical protein QJS10_CPA09g00510 [Acorus calamus]|uniref:Uncharacterized protein n=1 Tax=Acorus calamus TaxID=4465 RepID=A0AAV9E4C1_ACOCL|nr:hypothetical protein QJS10_CPA09g00510 [Acorus calamus]